MHVQSIVQQSLRRRFCEPICCFPFVSSFDSLVFRSLLLVSICIQFCQSSIFHYFVLSENLQFLFEFGFSSQSLVFHLYPVLAVSLHSSVCIQSCQSVHSFPFISNFASKCAVFHLYAVLPAELYTVIYPQFKFLHT